MPFYLCIAETNIRKCDFSDNVLTVGYIATNETLAPRIHNLRKYSVLAQLTTEDASVLTLKGYKLFNISDEHITEPGPGTAGETLYVSFNMYTTIYKHVWPKI